MPKVNERAEQIAANFSVTSMVVQEKLNGAAVSTWNLLVKAHGPLPWNAFVKELDCIMEARAPRRRNRGPTRTDVPTFRDVSDALSKAGLHFTRPKRAKRKNAESKNEESISNNGHPPSQQARPESTVGVSTTYKASAPASEVLKRIRLQVQETAITIDKVKTPTIVLAEKIGKIVAHLENCFHRLGSLALANEAKTIQDDIIQHAGEKRILEVFGLQDAEDAYKKQMAVVLETFSRQLVTTLGPARVRQSLLDIDSPFLDEHIAVEMPNEITTVLERLQSPSPCNMTAPEPAHEACRSPTAARSDSRNKRLREVSVEEPEGLNKTDAPVEDTIIVSHNERVEANSPALGQVVEPSLAEHSDAESESGASIVWGKWKIVQIKTAQFKSPEKRSPGKCGQCWSWEEGCLIYQVERQGEWVAPISIRFDVKWKDVEEVEVSKECWRAKLILKESFSTVPENRVVMVVFDGQETVQRFTDFCLHKCRKVSRLES